MGKKVPCWGCDKRKIGCHDECEAYKHFCKKRELIKKERAKEYEIEKFKKDVIYKSKKGLRYGSMKMDWRD